MSAATNVCYTKRHRSGHSRTSFKFQLVPVVHYGPFLGPVQPTWNPGLRAFEVPARGSVVTYARRKWYAIFEPSTVRGVYRVWEHVQRLVSGQSNSVHRGFASEAAALEWISHLAVRSQEEDAALEQLRQMIFGAEYRIGQPAVLAPSNRALASTTSGSTGSSISDSGPGATDASTLRPWQAGPIVLPVPTAPSREYYRKWYAVRFVDGGTPGVYNTWQEAEAAISGRYAEHRSYDSQAEALAYAFGPSYVEQLLPSSSTQQQLQEEEEVEKQGFSRHELAAAGAEARGTAGWGSSVSDDDDLTAAAVLPDSALGGQLGLPLEYDNEQPYFHPGDGDDDVGRWGISEITEVASNPPPLEFNFLGLRAPVLAAWDMGAARSAPVNPSDRGGPCWPLPAAPVMTMPLSFDAPCGSPAPAMVLTAAAVPSRSSHSPAPHYLSYHHHHNHQNQQQQVYSPDSRKLAGANGKYNCATLPQRPIVAAAAASHTSTSYSTPAESQPASPSGSPVDGASTSRQEVVAAFDSDSDSGARSAIGTGGEEPSVVDPGYLDLTEHSGEVAGSGQPGSAAAGPHKECVADPYQPSVRTVHGDGFFEASRSGDTSDATYDAPSTSASTSSWQQSSSSRSSTVSVKRRPGRPRKAAVVTPSHSNSQAREAETAPGRRKRGRPRKQPAPSPSAEGLAESVATRQRGRPRLETLSAEAEETQHKRRRGRPRRIDVAAVVGPSAPAVKVTADAAGGRKRKKGKAAVAAAGEVKASDKPKARRGRPPLESSLGRMVTPGGWAPQDPAQLSLDSSRPYILVFHLGSSARTEAPKPSSTAKTCPAPSPACPAEATEAAQSSSPGSKQQAHPLELSYSVLLLDAKDLGVVASKVGRLRCHHPAEGAYALLTLCVQVVQKSRLSSVQMVGTGLRPPTTPSPQQQQQKQLSGGGLVPQQHQQQEPVKHEHQGEASAVIEADLERSGKLGDEQQQQQQQQHQKPLDPRERREAGNEGYEGRGTPSRESGAAGRADEEWSLLMEGSLPRPVARLLPMTVRRLASAGVLHSTEIIPEGAHRDMLLSLAARAPEMQSMVDRFVGQLDSEHGRGALVSLLLDLQPEMDSLAEQRLNGGVRLAPGAAVSEDGQPRGGRGARGKELHSWTGYKEGFEVSQRANLLRKLQRILTVPGGKRAQ